MSDIVEELRRASARGMEHHAGPVRVYLDAEMLADAAAEIERLRAALKAAEAQRDALVAAAGPVIAETAREDRDDYRARVKTSDLRALAAAVAGAKEST